MRNKIVETVLNGVDTRLNELYEAAYMAIDNHWVWIREMEKRFSGWEQKSRLQVRCVKTGNSIQLGWSEIRWTGSKATSGRTALRIYIKRPKNSHQYTLSKLRGLARDWEADAVEALELELAKVRREAHFLVKAIGNIQNSQGIRCPIVEEDPMDEQD